MLNLAIQDGFSYIDISVVLDDLGRSHESNLRFFGGQHVFEVCVSYPVSRILKFNVIFYIYNARFILLYFSLGFCFNFHYGPKGQTV